MRNAIVGLGSVVVFLIGVWLVAFGATAPCDGLRAQAGERYAADPEETRQAVSEAILQMSPVQCAVAALRLKVGDKSAIYVAVVRK